MLPGWFIVFHTKAACPTQIILLNMISWIILTEVKNQETICYAIFSTFLLQPPLLNKVWSSAHLFYSRTIYNNNSIVNNRSIRLQNFLIAQCFLWNLTWNFVFHVFMLWYSDKYFVFLKYGKEGSCNSSEFLQKHLSDSYNKSSNVVWKFNFGNVLNILEEFSTVLI
jgi:hypothetical protein